MSAALSPTAEQLPSELLPVLTRLGGGLVLVHFSGINPRHPIQTRSRGGNVAGNISRELVAGQAGQHVETVHTPDCRTYIFRAPNVEAAAALLVAGAKRRGLADHACIFTVATPGLPALCWPLPASPSTAPATLFRPSQKSTSQPNPRGWLRVNVPRWCRAFFQRSTRWTLRNSGDQARNSKRSPALLLPVNRLVASRAKSTEPWPVPENLVPCTKT